MSGNISRSGERHVEGIVLRGWTRWKKSEFGVILKVLMIELFFYAENSARSYKI